MTEAEEAEGSGKILEPTNDHVCTCVREARTSDRTSSRMQELISTVHTSYLIPVKLNHLSTSASSFFIFLSDQLLRCVYLVLVAKKKDAGSWREVYIAGEA